MGIPARSTENPEPAHLASSLGDHPLPYRHRLEAARPKISPQLRQQRQCAASGLDRVGGLPVHPGRPRPSVCPHPPPRNQQEGRITDEVVEVIEPTVFIIGCPSVQLCLDLQYPRLRLFAVRPRRAGVHQRPPGMPVPPLRARCLPSPCSRLSRPRTTTEAPPRLRALSRQRACPPPPGTGSREGDSGTVPTFTMHRSLGEVASCAPAASPRVRRRPSPWPSSCQFIWGARSPFSYTVVVHKDGAHCCPAHIHQV